MILTVQEIQEWGAEEELPDGSWVPARPIDYQYQSILTRLKEAWMVFTGKGDVLLWRSE